MKDVDVVDTFFQCAHSVPIFDRKDLTCACADSDICVFLMYILNGCTHHSRTRQLVVRCLFSPAEEQDSEVFNDPDSATSTLVFTDLTGSSCTVGVRCI
jgi:hypothetical protein